MNKYLKKILLWTFVFGALLFVVMVNADAIDPFVATESSATTNNNLNQNINETEVAMIIKPDLWYRTDSGLW